MIRNSFELFMKLTKSLIYLIGKKAILPIDPLDGRCIINS